MCIVGHEVRGRSRAASFGIRNRHAYPVLAAGRQAGEEESLHQYRRDDAAGFSHAIHDRLVEFLADERVFTDVYGIETGTDFSKRLEAALAQCTFCWH